jgi:sacsin
VQSATTAAEAGREQEQEQAAAALAPVESAQLLSAVDDILSRVNLSLGEESKAVMERNLRMQRDLDAARREAEGAREQALGLSAQLDKIKAAFQCQVCFQRDVDQILAPCGHLLCGACREGVQATCPFCRERIRFIFPFFKPFSS